MWGDARAPLDLLAIFLSLLNNNKKNQKRALVRF